MCGEEFAPRAWNNLNCSPACKGEGRNRARRVANDPSARERNFAQNISRYGVTPDEYAALLASQAGRCAICGRAPGPNGRGSASRLHVDHCHTTGRVRGLLCVRCNPGIGHFQDRPDLLRAAIAYLEADRT